MSPSLSNILSKRDILAVALGAVVGALVVASMMPWTMSPVAADGGGLVPREQAAPQVPEFEDPAPDPSAARVAAQLRDELSACEASLNDQTRHLEMLRREVRALGGARSEWPPDVGPAFREPAVRDWLDEVRGAYRVEIDTLDCNEYPCIAVFRLPEDAAVASTVLEPLRDDFALRSGGPQSRINVFGTPFGAWGALLLSPEEGESAEVEQRIQLRLEELRDEVVDAARDEHRAKPM